MRPRVFPAEDMVSKDTVDVMLGSFNEAAGIPRGRPLTERLKMNRDDASMRPRVFPAEDVADRLGVPAHQLASMRPRVFPAEDVALHQVTQESASASMRPRVFPAEDDLIEF